MSLACKPHFLPIERLLEHNGSELNRTKKVSPVVMCLIQERYQVLPDALFSLDKFHQTLPNWEKRMALSRDSFTVQSKTLYAWSLK